MAKLFHALIFLATAAVAAPAAAQPAPSQDPTVVPMQAPAKLSVCFTPTSPCSHVLLSQIGAAKKEILVHAHNFTNRAIMKALIEAKGRGVDVEVIMNARHERNQSRALRTLVKAGVPVFVDDKVKVAHNKVMIFDRSSATTGSYNLTYSAEKRNAENLLLIQDSPSIVNAYVANWQSRKAVSHPARVAPKAANDNNPKADDNDDDDEN